MANALIAWENRLLSGTLSAGSEASGLTVGNLQNQHGSAAFAWRTGTGALTPETGAYLLCDAGADTATWRAFCVSRTNLTTAASWRVRIGNAGSVNDVAPLLAADWMADTPTAPAGWTWQRGGSGTGEATYFDASGVLQSAAAGVGRVAHDPATLARLGLLVEPARTNSIRNPRNEYSPAPTLPTTTAPTNWAFGTGGSLTVQCTGYGYADGLPYIDVRFSGSPTGTINAFVYFETTTGITAATAQAWVLSYYMAQTAAVSGGPTSIRSVLQEYDSTGATILATGTLTQAAPTFAHPRTQRFSLSRTLAGGASVARLRPSVVFDFPAGTHDVTYRICAPQAERGEFATMPILPAAGTPASATRPVEAASATLPASYLNTSGTLYAEQVTMATQTAAATVGQVRLDDATANNIVSVRTVSSGSGTFYNEAVIVAGGVTQADLNNRTVSAGAVGRYAFAWAPANGYAAGDGTPQGVKTSAYTQPGVTRLAIVAGERQAYIRRIRLYSSRLTDGQTLGLSGSGATVDASAVVYDSGTVSAGVVAGFAQAVHVAPAQVAGRYCRIDLTDAANPDNHLSVPLAFAGPVFQPGVNYAPETAFRIAQQRQVVRTRGGGAYVTPLWTERAWSLVFGALLTSELWAQVVPADLAAADGRNVLFVPDPAGANIAREAVFGMLETTADIGFTTLDGLRRDWRARIVERL